MESTWAAGKTGIFRWYSSSKCPHFSVFFLLLVIAIYLGYLHEKTENRISSGPLPKQHDYIRTSFIHRHYHLDISDYPRLVLSLHSGGAYRITASLFSMGEIIGLDLLLVLNGHFPFKNLPAILLMALIKSDPGVEIPRRNRKSTRDTISRCANG